MADENTRAPAQQQAAEEEAAARPVPALRRLRYLVPVFLFVALAAALGVQLLTGEPGKVPSALIDRPVPAFALPPVQGFEEAGGFQTADLGRGEVALVNVFASWCGPCRVEHPLLMALAEAGTVPLYGINYKDTPADAERWLGRLGNPYRLMGADLDGRAAIEWGVYGVPETFVVDGAGRIRHRHIGVLSRHDIDETILPLIEELRG
ncbi:MAG: DsbE family thiol:disulfide interchange protein [Alphaproteobacteria bacterium]|nr:DsbE family thiol:disulfide interchange protein [Alphaproteobacteria bacterium]